MLNRPLTFAPLLLALAACSSSPSSADGGADSGSDAAQQDAAPPSYGASVLQHHNSAARSGLYKDAAITRASAKQLHLDATFVAKLNGPTYAQPLFFDAMGAGKDLVIIGTEQDEVTAFDASNGAIVWQKKLGTPVKHSTLPSGCANIDPLGITSTGVIDPATRTVYMAAMTTDDDSVTKKHRIFALSLDDGAIKSGWPVDVSAALTNPKFDSLFQHQRGALALLGGTLYVPYGGHFECGGHNGWVVAVPTKDPTQTTAWRTRAPEGGVWAPGGIASDGTSLFITTGQSSQTAGPWADSKGLLRLTPPGPTFSTDAADYWAPTDWLSQGQDVGSAQPLPLDMPDSTPSKLLVAFARGGGRMVLLDRDNLGGVGGEIVKRAAVTSDIITAPITYTTDKGTYVVFNGYGTGCPNGKAGNLTAVKVTPGSPPTLSTAWCAVTNGNGIPMVTTTDGTHESVVWAVGTEGLDPKSNGTIPGDQRLHGFDGDTGEVLYDGGAASIADGGVDGGSAEGGAPTGDTMTLTRRYTTPIAAKGRIFVGADDRLYAFTVK